MTITNLSPNTDHPIGRCTYLCKVAYGNGDYCQRTVTAADATSAKYRVLELLDADQVKGARVLSVTPVAYHYH